MFEIPIVSQDQPIHQTLNSDQQNMQQDVPPSFNPESMAPLHEIDYLYQNAQCFKNSRELCNTIARQKSKKNNKIQITTQFLYGEHMPPYYSVLNQKLMNKFITHLKNPHSYPANVLRSHKEIIEHEQDLFSIWLSNLWEENLKNRRLNAIPFIENYIESACNFSNNYIKSHYNGTYSAKMKIDYNIRDEVEKNKIEMKYIKRVQTAEIKYTVNLPSVVDIKDSETKISFTDGVFNPTQKIPFVNDEQCRTLSQEHNIDVNICLSSMKNIMNLEKPNSLWIIPVNVDIDADQHKTIYVGGSLCTGHFSQQEKSLYYLRKELKKKFRKPLPNATVENNYSDYNYDVWNLKAVDTNGTTDKSFNILVRNKCHVVEKPMKSKAETVIVPKVEYQPEFGFEKLTEEQLIEYWLDTNFRCPITKLTIVSVQPNMDLMLVKSKVEELKSLSSDGKDQIYLQRLQLTLDKLTQLDKGEYVLLHNPKKPFLVDLYQLSVYGGFSLLNMYFILQKSEVFESLTWNPIDPKMVCPIHDYFHVAPCMFRPNPTELDVNTISQQVNKFNTARQARENNEKVELLRKKRIKKEKTKIKRKLQREADPLNQMKRKMK